MLYNSTFYNQYHHRLKSSVVLGSEQPEKAVDSPRRKSVVRKVNPITGEVEGDAELDLAKLVIR